MKVNFCFVKTHRDQAVVAQLGCGCEASVPLMGTCLAADTHVSVIVLSVSGLENLFADGTAASFGLAGHSEDRFHSGVLRNHLLIRSLVRTWGLKTTRHTFAQSWRVKALQRLWAGPRVPVALKDG